MDDDSNKDKRRTNQFFSLLQSVRVGTNLKKTTAEALFQDESVESAMDSIEHRYQTIEKYFIQDLKEVPEWDTVVNAFLEVLLKHAESGSNKPSGKKVHFSKATQSWLEQMEFESVLVNQVQTIEEMGPETIIQLFDSDSVKTVTKERSTKGQSLYMYGVFYHAVTDHIKNDAHKKKHLHLVLDIMKDIAIRILIQKTFARKSSNDSFAINRIKKWLEGFVLRPKGLTHGSGHRCEGCGKELDTGSVHLTTRGSGRKQYLLFEAPSTNTRVVFHNKECVVNGIPYLSSTMKWL
ncbi:hypothetical protein RFI_11637, partial [Reticulomyxa filosa]